MFCGRKTNLHIEAVKMAIAIEETYDTFIIDNIVVFFKTNVLGARQGRR